MVVLVGIALEPALGQELQQLAQAQQYTYIGVDDPQEASAALADLTCDVALFSFHTDNKGRWASVNQISLLPGAPDIIALVPEGDAETAEFAVQSGAWDVVPATYFEDIKISLSRCLYHRLARHSHIDFETIKREGIVGDSPRLERCLRQMSIAARSDSSVLILGETGTGKELFARAVHENSPRAAKPLIVVDCTNLPATLAESILFGHAKGSFTGATEARDGLFKQADGGTIFLDEIGDLDLNVQKSLLRVIQERRFRPLSAKHEIQCDFRIIAATNRDLQAMVEAGTFRQDLYHRITTRTITLPPLRERAEDIPVMVAHYLELFCRNLGCTPKEMANETIDALKLYNWPGNVRELVNVVHTTVLNGIVEKRLYPQHLPEELRRFWVRARVFGQLKSEAPGPQTGEPPFNSASDSASGLSFPQASLSGLSGQRTSANSGMLGHHAPAHPAGPAAGIPGLSNAVGVAGHLYSPSFSVPAPFENAGPHTGNGHESGRSEQEFFAFAGYALLPPLRNVREDFIEKMEYFYLADLIRRCAGDFSRARDMSGLSRARLYELLQKHSLSI